MWSYKLTDAFSDNLTVEDRVPVLIFDLPSFLGGPSRRYGVLPPKLSYWVQLVLLVSTQILMSAAFGTIVYKFIVAKKGAATSYLVGFCVILPLALIVPFAFIEALDLQSKTLRMTMIAMPILVSFRCMEAMFGFIPSAPAKSLSHYIVYNAGMMETVFHPSTRAPMKATWRQLLDRIRHFFSLFVLLTALFSATSPYKYAPFVTRCEAHTLEHKLSDMAHTAHLVNNFIAALLVSVSLSFSTLGVSLLFNLTTGIMTEKVVLNPLFASRSPSDFWGRRWNNLVHSVLKRGVFKPVLKLSSSKTAAVLATFLASGLMHEWVWAILFYVNCYQKDAITGKCAECFQPVWGKNMAFFGWNGMVIALETALKGWFLFPWMGATLPKRVKSALVLLTALPVSHLFTGDWIAGDYFSHFQLGFPLVVELDSTQ